MPLIKTILPKYGEIPKRGKLFPAGHDKGWVQAAQVGRGRQEPAEEMRDQGGLVCTKWMWSFAQKSRNVGFSIIAQVWTWYLYFSKYVLNNVSFHCHSFWPFWNLRTILFYSLLIVMFIAAESITNVVCLSVALNNSNDPVPPVI